TNRWGSLKSNHFPLFFSKTSFLLTCLTCGLILSMSKPIQIVLRWLPALLLMLVIFLFSSRSASDLPSFDWADRIVKKGGHMIGYALLAASYWRALNFRKEKWWLAWCFAVLYAVTDEFHQSMVPGRYASIWDVMIFDNFGALISLWLFDRYKKQKRPDPVHPIAEKLNANRY
ncbi:MAG TPA: VanZ family protein, partial [Anaerolineales bacterium]|nr:VanZ family protein [Anaerolineales bacterium]